VASIAFNIPTKPKGARKVHMSEATGRVAFFEIAGRKIKFILQNGHDGKPESLVHYASGFVFGRLNGPKLEYAVRNGCYLSLSDRGAAETLIARAVESKGAEFVLGVIDAAPVINH
jgi:hypothetical protein